MVRQKLRVYENTELLICKEQWTEKALAWDLNDANNQAWQSLICLALHISLFRAIGPIVMAVNVCK